MNIRKLALDLLMKYEASETYINLSLSSHSADNLTAEERARLTAEMKKNEGEIERIEKKLANEGFVSKAPAAVIEGERAKLSKYLEVRESLAAALAKLK